MLSILIPTYDFNCYPLVLSLHEQAERCGEPYEIIVADDGSHDQVTAIANHKINDLPHCRYIRRSENVGRAAIRNALVAMAQGNRLLLLDCDAKVEQTDFLSRYLAEEGPVVVGGLYHSPECKDPHRSLRHKYERNADRRRDAATRSLQPYAEFTAFNVLIDAKVFEHLHFDTDCWEYGYEDVLFGAELQRLGIAVTHIDNALLHTGIDTNSQFIQKTHVALRTLAHLGNRVDGHSHVLGLYTRFQRYHIAWTLRLGYRLLSSALERHLTHSSNPSLQVFSLYKLLYFASLHP